MKKTNNKGLQMKKYIVTISTVLACIIGAQGSDLSQAQKQPQASTSKDMREQMAVAHEKMAVCLRSVTAIEDCHQQMRGHCQEMGDAGGCFMMGKMGGGMMKYQKKSDSVKGK
jgi:hypothetical protein